MPRIITQIDIDRINSKSSVEKRRKTMLERYKGKWPNLVGKTRQDKKGYLFVYRPKHPKSYKDGFIRQHRIIMEKMLGRYLEPHEEVHHKNGIKSDNRESNLQLVIRNNHYGQVKCPYCKGNFLIK